MKNEKNSRKRLNSLILLVAFTAIMLIVSTYAWFTMQNNVKISSIKGSVGAVSGLEVSIDGATWTNSLTIDEEALKTVNNSTNNNVLPTKLTPVSTTANATDRSGGEVTFYNGTYTVIEERDEDGKLTDNTTLSSIATADAGYYAIDLYLKNTSEATSDPLKLTKDSIISIADAKASTGLQNTVRLGLALSTNKVSDVLSDGATVLATNWGDLKDVAIWEPNANDHVSEVLRTNDRVTVDSIVPGSLAATSQIPTYALSAAATSVTDATINNIYTWDASAANKGLVKQNTVQTPKAGITTEVPLLSANDGKTAFALAGNGIYKMRVYLWLEGQDVDTINHAALGEAVTLNLGFTK